MICSIDLEICLGCDFLITESKIDGTSGSDKIMGGGDKGW